MWRGTETSTPDPFAGSPLDRLEAKLDAILQRIDTLEQAILENGDELADRAVGQVRDLVTQTDPVALMQAAAEELAATVERLQAQPEPVPGPARTSTRDAGTANRRAVRSASR